MILGMATLMIVASARVTKMPGRTAKKTSQGRREAAAG